MVGFGSSLRMSRRRGWESAYLDYESLKLLLTHIEAVYEETRHLANRSHMSSGTGGFGLGMISGSGGHGHGAHDHNAQHHDSALGHVNFHFFDNEDDMGHHHSHQVGRMGSPVSRGDGDGGHDSGGRQQQQQRRAPLDYRDELFLESDSDYAYLSVGEESNDDGDSTGHQDGDVGSRAGGGGGGDDHHDGGGDAYEYDNIDDEEGDDVGNDLNQTHSYGATATVGVVQQEAVIQGDDIWRQEHLQQQHSQYGSGGVSTGANVDDNYKEDDAYLADMSDHIGAQPASDRFIYEPLSQVNSESSKLLYHNTSQKATAASPAGSSNFFSIFNRKKKDEARRYRERQEQAVQQQHQQEQQPQTGTLTNFGRSVVVGVGPSRPSADVGETMDDSRPRVAERAASLTGKKVVNGEVTTGKRRVKKRRTKKKRKRRRRRKVPLHILIAHSKARAITERFLGLLRAEVEKVTLFAHARMGELADTIGSLRFPSYEDGTMGNAGVGDYPLSDGGIHPSASSSSDEMGRSFSWSDTSDEERAGDHMDQKLASTGGRRETRLQGRSVAAAAASVAAGSKRQAGSGRRTADAPSSHRGVPYQTLSGNRQDDLALQQIQHGEQLRIDRPTFQRAEHVLDDDFLLLSAVDEADAFAAVGVELMHLLRYICVNVIAVRKICKKHDRLLANRMLGGYYHRLREQRRMSEIAFKGLGLRKKKTGRVRQAQNGLSGLDGGASGGQTPLLGRMFASSMGNELEGNLDKLVGVLDIKVQQLANSTTIEMISSVLAFALAEYEISQNRADALSKVNTATALHRGGSSGNSLASFDADEIDGLCYHFPIPRPTTYLSPKKAAAISSGQALDQKCPIERICSSNSHDFDSDSSNMSLTRLKFVVASVYGLREAARPKQNHFRGFLSRAAMTFTGPNEVGDGLDGCSRETLEFLVSYDPDAALFVPCNTLYRSLQRGKSKGTVCGVMTASLAAANDGGGFGSDYTVQNALTIMPVPSDYEYLESGLSSTLKGWKATVADGDVIVQRGTVRLNRFALFLYTMNYYIISPSARAHMLLLGEQMAHSATLIGAASVSSLLGALLHSYLLSKDDTASKLPSAGPFFFRVPLILCAMSALAGNIIYADASRHGSLLMAYCGRLLVGFGSAEVLNCNLISKCIPPAGLVSESAKLVKASMIGILLGPLIGTFLAIGETEAMLPNGQETLQSPRSVSAPGYFMAGLWFLQICGLLCFFQEPKKKANTTTSNTKVGGNQSGAKKSQPSSGVQGTPADERFVHDDNGFVSDSSSASHQDAEASEKRNLLYRTLSDSTPDDLKTAFGTTVGVGRGDSVGVGRDDTSRANSKNFAASDDEYTPTDVVAEKLRLRRRRSFLSTMNRARKLVFHNIALPATIAILAFATFSQETLFSSCAIITHRYFRWNSALAGLWLTALGAIVLPVNYVVESVSRYREERIVMKLGLLSVTLGLVIIVNYEALLVLLLHLRDVFRETQGIDGRPTMYYDWSLGIVQYIVGTFVIMASITAIEGCTLSLMSKVAPSKLESNTLNLGLIVSIIRPSTRFMADILILVVGLSHRIINTDIINSLSLVLLCACCAVYYVVKRHYFFLSG